MISIFDNYNCALYGWLLSLGGLPQGLPPGGLPLLRRYAPPPPRRAPPPPALRATSPRAGEEFFWGVGDEIKIELKASLAASLNGLGSWQAVNSIPETLFFILLIN